MIKKFLYHPFLRFLFVGGLNTAFGYLVYAFLVYLIKNAYIAVILATIVGILFNFKTYGSLVFKSKDNAKLKRFFAVYLCTMVVQISLLKALTSAGVSNSYVAGGILTLPMALMSFLLMRKFVFAQVQESTAEKTAG